MATESMLLRPLSHDKVRLLKLSVRNPGGAEAGKLNLDLSFTTVSLEELETLDFVALSYTWGDYADTVTVLVDGVGPIPITRNLFEIFSTLGSGPPSDCPKLLWVDALCINQNDFNERAEQVTHMHNIYTRASHVLIFLSSSSKEFEIGLQFLEKTAANPKAHFEPSLQPHNFVQDGSGVLDLNSEALRESIIAFFATSWWTRLWTVQEFALAQQTVFQCGHYRVDGKTIVAAFDSLRDHERACCWAARRGAHGETLGGVDLPSAAHGGLSLFTAVLRINHLVLLGETFGSRVNGLLDAMGVFRQRQCSDPRDRIYGMLALRTTESALHDAIAVDYTLPARDLFQQFAVQVVQTQGNLNVLSHIMPNSSPTLKELENLPSWVPDWTSDIDGSLQIMYSERIFNLRLLWAAGDTMADWSLFKPGVISTKMIKLAVITSTAPGHPCPDPDIRTNDLLHLWRRLYGLQEELPRFETPWVENCCEQNFRIDLTGALTLDAWNKEEASHHQAYKKWYTWFTHEDPHSLPSEMKGDARDFDDLVKQITAARCLVKAENGTTGFATECAKAGDVLTIMPGGHVCYVLRHVEGKTFQYVGDAIVQGFMQGEALPSDSDPDSRQWEDIFLV